MLAGRNIYNKVQQGISKPEFYGDLVYRFRKENIWGIVSEQFRNSRTVIKELDTT